ncbi:hypothetical protein [Streptomyces sp.]|uniref:hypothetical protein n=1 Tax=Streptomyces sp. TaxID=1931 RepID=UPI00281270B9|nr:hypothetical protein [Streptomyces sp.]
MKRLQDGGLVRVVVAHQHNADGEVTKVTDALGHSRHAKYTGHLLQSAIDAKGTGTDGTGGNTTTYGWDGRNNALSQKLPLGATASVTAYQTVAGTDLPNDFTTADGRKDTFKCDTNGNTMSVTASGTADGIREYTSNKDTPTCGGFEGQRCTAKDANGKVTSFEYDTKGNLKTVTPPAPLGKTEYTYDALGRVETATDERGIKTVYVYDNRDRVTKVSSTNATVTYSYDGDGNVRTRTDASGSTGWTYDELNRESVRTLQNGAQTALAYTPGGEVDHYTDPTGTTDYTCTPARAERRAVAPDPKPAKALEPKPVEKKDPNLRKIRRLLGELDRTHGHRPTQDLLRLLDEIGKHRDQLARPLPAAETKLVERWQSRLEDRRSAERSAQAAAASRNT